METSRNHLKLNSMTQEIIDIVDQTLAKHEELHRVNEEIIKKQKEYINKLTETINQLKDIIDSYILKDVKL